MSRRRRRQRGDKLIGKTFVLGGWAGVLVLVLALLGGYYRMESNQDVQDPKLDEAVAQYLMTDANGALTGKLNQMREQGSYEGAAELLKEFNSGPEIHKISVSQPLLKWSATEDVILRVEYTLPLQDSAPVRRVEYLKAVYNRITGSWRVWYKTSEYSYYLNFF